MSSLIPVSGEIAELAPPKSEKDILLILGSPGVQKHLAPDGSSWWEANPVVMSVNDRATRFFKDRCGASHPVTIPLRGEILYLSTKETKMLAGSPTKEDYVPVHGRTYDVRDRLKAIGARWYAEEKVWKVPKAVLEMANDIVRKGP